MCGTCATADGLSEVGRARRFADALATDLLRLPLAKAMDLGTPRGFDRAVASLAAELRRQAGRPERDAVRAAVNVLDVDWRSTTPEQRRRLVSEAMNAAALATAVIPARIQATLGPAAEAVVAAIQAAGGLTLLAHPARYRLPHQRLIAAAAAAGFDGAEAWYDYDMQGCWAPTPVVCEAIATDLQERGLLLSCGTDTHGLELNGR